MSWILALWRPTTAYRVAVGQLPSNLRRDQLIALIVAEKDAELRGAAPFNPRSWPDLRERRQPSVELRGVDLDGELVVEHTVIESYPEQIADGQALLRIFPLGGPELSEVPNAGHFRLIIRPGSMGAVQRRRRPAVARAITSWVRKALPDAPWPHRPGSPTFISGSVPDVLFDLALERWTDSIGLIGPLARVVMITYWRPADLETRRIERLRRALETKIPKLLKASSQGRRSVLVLEDRDLHMSAPAFVSRALEQASQGMPLPDVIYLLNATGGNPLLLRIYEAGAWYHTNIEACWLTFSNDRAAAFHAVS